MMQTVRRTTMKATLTVPVALAAAAIAFTPLPPASALPDPCAGYAAAGASPAYVAECERELGNALQADSKPAQPASSPPAQQPAQPAATPQQPESPPAQALNAPPEQPAPQPANQTPPAQPQASVNPGEGSGPINGRNAINPYGSDWVPCSPGAVQYNPNTGMCPWALQPYRGDGTVEGAPPVAQPQDNSLNAGVDAATNIPGLGDTPLPPVLGPQVASNGPAVRPGETQATPPVDGEQVGNVWYQSSCAPLNGLGGCWVTFGGKIVDDPRLPANGQPAPPPVQNPDQQAPINTDMKGPCPNGSVVDKDTGKCPDAPAPEAEPAKKPISGSDPSCPASYQQIQANITNPVAPAWCSPSQRRSATAGTRTRSPAASRLYAVVARRTRGRQQIDA